MSGVTTTGTTAFPDLDNLPKGTNLWRAFLNWAGGLGIIVVAMIFLPAMKVGGMQFFRSEGFDTLGKILPRAFDIAREMTGVYIAMTASCMVVYILLGMKASTRWCWRCPPARPADSPITTPVSRPSSGRRNMPPPSS